MSVLAAGQQAWLLAAGKPTRRADAPLGTPAVVGVRLIAGVSSPLLQSTRIETKVEHLVVARDALGELEPDARVLHDGRWCTIIGGPIPVEPDGGLVAYPIHGGA